MGKGRLEAFSDGVIAIIITIMVLELKVPHGDNLDALLPLFPVFLSYVLSFIYVGIYWNKLNKRITHHFCSAKRRLFDSSGDCLSSNNPPCKLFLQIME